MTDECGCPADRGHSHPRIATTPLGPFTPETTRGFATIERIQNSGIRLMPWQREFLLRAGEINPNTGMLRFRTFLLVVSRQNGKSVGSTELMHTKRGLIPHGELVPGDYVYNADGRWTEVLVNHGPERRPMYRVTLRDGTSLVVGDTHEWEVADHRHKTAGAPTVKVIETRAMLETGLRYRGYRYRLPRRPVLEGIPVADLPMDRAALSIVSIEPAPDAVSNCITIADPRGVYLAGPELVPTHNSTAAAAQILQWLMEDVPGESPALILGAAHTLQIAIEIWDSVVGIATADLELTARLARVRRSNGNIAVTTTSSSRYLPIAATADAARGWSATRVFIDELRTHTDWSSYGALDKTRIAKPGSQVLAASNSGSERSVVFAALRAAAIGSLDDPDTTVGIAEWSAGEDRDIADREGWREAIPALGYTLPWDSVENSLRIDDPAVFRAEMLCQSVAIESTALDATGWAACGVPARPAPQGHVHLAVSGDQGRVVVAAADETDSGNVQVRIVGDWHGANAVREAATELRRLQRRLKARSVTWAPGMDPAIEAALRSVPPNIVQKATTSQLAAGCLILAREVVARSLRHGDQAVLNAEAVNAGRKASGNGWLFDAPEHPAALWAASMAVRAARTTFTTKEEV